MTDFGASSQPAAGVDVGGTFTDVVVIDAGSRPQAVKVPTTPDDQGEGVATGVAAAYRRAPVAVVAHGTTAATNAILERKVARTALVVTAGFADVLLIGRQNRPSLYDLTLVRPAPLVPPELVVAARERTSPDGTVVASLSDEEIDRVVGAVAALEPEAVAVCLLFGYANPGHEQSLAAALGDRLRVPVSRSSALLAEFREYERASTTSINAALTPVMRRYLSGLERRLPEPDITVMTSAGGTAGIDFATQAPVHTLLSGPAAGVVAAAAVARTAGYPDAIAFDMGGTSTDVCLIRRGRPTLTTEASIDGLPFRTPAVDIHTVGAGGGSIAWIDTGGALHVGPQSAGARPGPACYGQGGSEPTVTDAHCALGHLDQRRQLGGGLRLLHAPAAKALATLPEDSQGADGVLTVVRATMARALRRVSIERGVDPGELALVSYGGAGPMHATALARELGCAAVIVPPAPGVLSALGLLLAPARYEASLTVMAAAEDDLSQVWSQLESDARAELRRQGIQRVARLVRLADCRYTGQSHELRVTLDDTRPVADVLHKAHKEAYGYAMADEPVELVTARVVAEGEPQLGELPADWDQGRPTPETRRRIGISGRWMQCRVLHRAALQPGDTVDGPALVEQLDTTTLLAPGDVARVDTAHNLVVTFHD